MLSLKIILLSLIILFALHIPCCTVHASNSLNLPEDHDDPPLNNNALISTATPPTDPLASLKKEFMGKFFEVMAKTIDANLPLEERIKMPMGPERRADKFIAKAILAAQKEAYVKHLSQFLCDHYSSLEIEARGVTNLIAKELKGEIPSSEGYAIDYIVNTKYDLRPFVLKSLLENYSGLSSVYDMEKVTTQNIIWDFANHTNSKWYFSIDNISKKFAQEVSKFQHILEYLTEVYPTYSQRNEAIKDMKYVHQDISSEEDLKEIKRYFFATNKLLFSFYLKDMARMQEHVSWFVPIVELLITDKQVTRELKKDKATKGNEVLDTLLNSYNKYQDLLKKLKFYQQSFDETPSFEALDRPTPLAPFTDHSEKRPRKTKKIQRVPALPPQDHPKKENQPLSLSKLEPKTHEVRSSQQSESTSSKEILQDWISHSWVSPLPNLKSLYSAPSEQELKNKRKRAAKEQKRNNNRQEGKEEKGKEKEEEEERAGTQITPVVGPLLVLTPKSYSLFQSLVEKNYKGDMTAIVELIKTQFKGKAVLNKGRWHFGIPHITQVNRAILASALDPLEGDGEEEETIVTAPQASEKEVEFIHSLTTVHVPHKSRGNQAHSSKNLRPYHVRTLNEMFERGGYTLENVTDRNIPLKT
jgi:hypothetical protein